jgi:PAS domain S-box-containing protein
MGSAVQVNAKILIVGSDKAYPPYEYLDEAGRPKGFNIDIIKAVAEVMGLAIEIRPDTWNVIRRQIEAGEIDLVSGMFRSLERDKKVDFSTPHLTVSHGVFVRHDSLIQGLEDIRNKQVIVQKNDIGHDFIMETGLTDKIIAMDQWTDTVELLARGTGDCAVLSRLQAMVYTYTNHIDNLKVVGPPIKPRGYCFAVTEGNTQLLAQLNEGLSLIMSNGQYDKIYNQWFNKWEKKSIIREYLVSGIVVLGGVLSIFLILVFWSWSLKRTVRNATEDLCLERDASFGIIQKSPTLIAGIAPDGRIRSMNPAGEAITGIPAREIVGTDWKTLLSPGKENNRLTCLWDEVFLGRRDLVNSIMPIVARDGSPRLISCTTVTKHDPEGFPVEVILFGDNITEQKRAERALSESERKLKTLINNLPGMAYRGMNDPERTMSFVSEGCLPLMGVARSELVFCYKQSFYDLIHPEDREGVRDAMAAAIKAKRPFQFEYRICTATGDVKWVWEQGVGFQRQDDGPVSIEGFITDITDRKMAEAGQKMLEEQLRQSHKMEAVGTLAGGIAHDFNNILGAIIGYGQILTLFTSGADTRYEKRVNQMLKAAFRGRDLVRQILAFSRKSDGKPQHVLLRPLIKEALNFLRASLPATISIEERIASGNLAVLADPSQMHQVLMNLCSNAAQAMDGSGGVLEVSMQSIHFDGLNEQDALNPDSPELVPVPAGFELLPGEYLKVRVKDSGHGIDPDVQKRIFDPFFTTKPPGKGTGMGLSVVHGIVKDHGGQIMVESRPGHGSVFSVYLPARHGDDGTKVQGCVPLPSGQGNILFVDDEKPLVEIAVVILEELGYCVTGVCDSKGALEIFKQDPAGFDMVITDNTMPKMTGIELSCHIMDIRPEIPIVLVTGINHGGAKNRALAAGINDFVVKPLDAGMLAKITREYIKNV